MIVAAVLQLVFVALTFCEALYQVWKFWGYGGGYITYSADTFWLFGGLSLICVFLATWASSISKPFSIAWAISARYTAIVLFVVATLLYGLWATPALQIRTTASSTSVEKSTLKAAPLSNFKQ